MANCEPSEFQKLIEWSSGQSQGVVRHVIDVKVSEHKPGGFESDNFFGTLSFFAAPLALPPLWLDDLLAGTAVDPSSRSQSVIVTIGLSKPVIRIWLRFMSGSSERRFATLSNFECTRGDKDGLVIKDDSGDIIELTKGTEIHIPTGVGRALG